MKHLISPLCMLLLAFFVQAQGVFKPGALWYDDRGELINAHGGGILYAHHKYYWFGEKRGRQVSEGVTVYSSADLAHWTYEGLALAPNDTDTSSDIARGCLMERPKVIYNPATKKYVMWFHLELRGQGYGAARAAVAVSDKVTGPYIFLSSCRPNGNMSRDMTLFTDDDGVAYLIYSSNKNYDLRIVKLADNYLAPSNEDKLMFSKHREAPAVFKYGGRYYLVTSGCTGWTPNSATVHTATSVMGPWVQLPDNPMRGPDAATTFGGQSNYVLPVAGKKDSFIFMADKWNPANLTDSRYLWLPLQWDDGQPVVAWQNEWRLGAAPAAAHAFVLSDTAFLLDGRPFQMISGEMHYPRIPREAWRQRMKMARAMGLNTIGTYVFWNLHEPQKGRFDFSGNNDIAAFVRTAQEEGLWVILRPSPYVCAEWEFGGYPYWLQNEKGLVLRSKEAKYLEEYKKYIMEVGRQLAPLQVNHGGNILMVQVENEYGSYGADKQYLDINRKLFIAAGFDGLLYTCDPAPDLVKGHLPGLLPAVNGLDNPEEVKKLVRDNHNGKGPFYIAEWYPAWFDWWGAPHHTVPSEKYTAALDSILTAGISINMYMFHGGTTRGFMNGANCKKGTPYEPEISSYDYDAPLDEAGNATDKFMQFRAVIQKHLHIGQILPDVPAPKKTIAIPSVQWQDESSIFNILPRPVVAPGPLSFESLNQDYGYVLYRTTITGDKPGWLKIKEPRDYGMVFVNGRRQGIVNRMLNQDSLFINIPEGEATLDLLVENLGRINFGTYLLENKKGITGKVTLDGRELKHWEMFSLPFDSVGSMAFSGLTNKSDGPVIRKGVFTLQETGDTYLDMRNWGKGCVWINGHALGRYWSIGPQQTLYLPAEWLRKGQNDVIVLELIKPLQNELHGLQKPILGVNASAGH